MTDQDTTRWVKGGTPWRVGRHVGRTIYDARDELLGTLDTPELATRVVQAVNGLAALDAAVRATRAMTTGDVEITHGVAVTEPSNLPSPRPHGERP